MTDNRTRYVDELCEFILCHMKIDEDNVHSFEFRPSMLDSLGGIHSPKSLAYASVRRLMLRPTTWISAAPQPY